MSNGGGVDDHELDEKKNREAADEFGRAIAKVAVAQICERIGFQSSNDSALESLADIAIRYVKDLGKTAKFYANVANRSDCNVFDVIQSLEDLRSSIGFPGGSEICTSLVKSGSLKEIMEYVEEIEELPFAQPVPNFPIVKDKRLTPTFLQMGETPAYKHVPDWLPAFPDPHTYIHSAVWNERTSDPRSDKVELARQRRKAENSLLSLQKRLLTSTNDTSKSSNGSKKSKLLAVASSSSESEKPFLDSDIQGGEAEAVIDMGNHVSIMEAFAPVIEALNSRVSESGENGERDVLLDKRPAVRMNFSNGRKLIGDSLDLRLWNRGTGKISSWFGRDDVMDEKKRRAEFILRQSMENRLDLPQL